MPDAPPATIAAAGVGGFAPPEPHRRWTQGDITALRAATAEGGTLDALAATLGRSPAAVTIMMDRLRLRC